MLDVRIILIVSEVSWNRQHAFRSMRSRIAAGAVRVGSKGMTLYVFEKDGAAPSGDGVNTVWHIVKP